MSRRVDEDIRRLSQKLHNILSTNWISTLWRCISWTTSLTISASFGTSCMRALNSKKEQWCISKQITDHWVVRRPPSWVCEQYPKTQCSSIESWIQMLQHKVVSMFCHWAIRLSRDWWKTRDRKSRLLMTRPSGMQRETESDRMTLVGVSRDLLTSLTTPIKISISVDSIR